MTRSTHKGADGLASEPAGATRPGNRKERET